MTAKTDFLVLCALLAATGCSGSGGGEGEGDTSNGSESADTSGDGDGDSGDGDGDGDSGDGDGDPSTGDGDGDGDGDGCNPGELSCECNNGLCLGDLVCLAGTCQEPDPEQNNALVRFVHLSADLGPVDVYLDQINAPLWSGLSFRDGVDYLQVAPGNHTLTVTVEGQQEAIATIDASNLESFIRYSASVYGDADDPSSKMVLDNTLNVDQASVRMQIVHTASGWGQIDLYNIDANPDAQLLNNFSLDAVIEQEFPAMIGGLGVDLDNDGTSDREFQIPGYPGGGFYDLYLVQGQVPFMLFHKPDGSTEWVEYEAVCGDGYVSVGEVCDDGNDADTDACLNGCIPASCGDGHVWDGMEECDDGNEIVDECLNDCEIGWKYLFMTSTLHDGAMNGYEGANIVCNQLAGNAGLPGTYKAWLSDDGGSPSTRMTHADIPYARVDGQLVAANWDDLIDGSLNAPPNRDEHGNLGPVNESCHTRSTWTNTRANGEKHWNDESCGNWNEVNQNGIVGDADSVSSSWSQGSGCYSGCSATLALLCIQQ